MVGVFKTLLDQGIEIWMFYWFKMLILDFWESLSFSMIVYCFNDFSICCRQYLYGNNYWTVIRIIYLNHAPPRKFSWDIYLSHYFFWFLVHVKVLQHLFFLGSFIWFLSHVKDWQTKAFFAFSIYTIMLFVFIKVTFSPPFPLGLFHRILGAFSG